MVPFIMLVVERNFEQRVSFVGLDKKQLQLWDKGYPVAQYYTPQTKRI